MSLSVNLLFGKIYWPIFQLAELVFFRVACVAGGVVSAREIKFWRRRQLQASRQKRAAIYFARAYNTASYAGYLSSGPVQTST